MPGMSKKEKRLQKRMASPAPVIIEPPKPKRTWKLPSWKLPSWKVPSWKIPPWIVALVRSPATAYVSITLLQLKTIWGMWWYRDLTSGDTAAYFVYTVETVRTGTFTVVWSPLYVSFYRFFFRFSQDAYVITILHRVVMVLILAPLVLAFLRRLLPAGVAWMAAVWWVVLPINFDVLYEVHLFVVIPLILGLTAIAWWPGPWGRGTAIAALLATSLLLRNEYVVATVLLAAICMGWEFYCARKNGVLWSRLALGYGIPMLACLLLTTYYYVHRNNLPISLMMEEKHELNICESFALGYNQYAPDSNRSPSDCTLVMQPLFGKPMPSLREALFKNPRAMIEYFWWNVKLIPNGLEVLLFNYRAGRFTPSIIETYQTKWVLIPSLIVLIVTGTGLFFLVREWRYWWERWLRERAWIWIGVGCVLVAQFVVILTIRPNSSYLFMLGIALRAAAAMCFWVLISRWPRLQRAGTIGGVLFVLAVCATPSLYQIRPDSLSLKIAYRRVAPFQKLFSEPNATFLSDPYGDNLTAYAGICHCKLVYANQLRSAVTAEKPFETLVQESGATIFLAEERLLGDPVIRDFVSNAATHHWQVLAERHEGRENWAVLHRIQ